MHHLSKSKGSALRLALCGIALVTAAALPDVWADHITPPGTTADRGALRFDSKTDRVEIPNDGWFDVSEQLTIETWVHIDTYPNSASWAPLISKGTDWGLFVRNNGQEDKLAFITGTSATDELVYVQTLTGWHHVAAVSDGAEKRLFIDGHQVASGAYPVPLATSGTTLFFGDPASNTKFFDGSLDAVRIWSVARTEAEIQADIDRDLSALNPPSTTRDLTGLLGEWRFDELSGSTAVDSSGNLDSSDNRRDGTQAGSPEWIDGLDFLAPPPLSSVARHALRFDGPGAAQSIIISEESDFDQTPALTLETWINVAGFEQETQPVITKGNAWGLYIESEENADTGTLVFKTDGGNLTGSTMLLPNRWYHIAASYDETGGIHLYVDGLADAVQISGALGATEAPVVIGGNADELGETLHATLDNVRIWQSYRDEAQLGSYRFNEILAYEPDLLGEWRFNESSGNQTYDQSLGDDRRRHGTLVNLGDLNRVAGLDLTVQAPVADQTDSALVFSGGSLNLGLDFAPDHQVLLDEPDALTLETWLRIDALSPGETQAILTRGKAWGLAVRDDGTVVFYSHDGTTRHDLESESLLQTGRWYHLAAVFGRTVKTIHVDGLLDATASPADGSFSGHLGLTEKAIRLGSLDEETPATNMEPLQGKLDAVRIWTKARSAGEILTTMDHQLSGSETDLFSAWRFDSGQANEDSSRWNRGLEGTISATDHTDGLEFLPPLSGNLALAFYQNGSDEYATVSDNPALDLTDAMTVETWVRVDEWPTSETGLISKGADAWALTANAAGKVIFRTAGVTGAPAIELTSSQVLEPGTWYHVAATWGPNPDPSNPNSIKMIYINGAPDVIDAGLAGAIPPNSFPVVFGAEPTSTTARENFLTGALDEVRIWDFARTPEQIRASLSRTVNGNEPGLVGAWPFDNILVPDMAPNTSLKGNALDAQLTSAAPIHNRADGRILGDPTSEQYALFFDGIDDTVNIGANSKFDLSGGVTIEAWARPIPLTMPIASVEEDTETLTVPAHGLDDGATVMIQTTGALPLPLEPDVAYYVVGQTPDTIQLATSPGGDAIDLRDQGSGIHILRPSSWQTIVHSSAFGLALDANNFLRFYVNGLIQNALSSNHAVMSDEWQHVGVVVDADANTATFYIDGKPAGTHSAPALPTTTGALTIGSQGGATNTNFFRGELDEVRIWQTAREDYEVNLFALQEIPSGTSNLAGYYDFNDGRGTILGDQSGVPADGTVTGGTWSYGPDFGVPSLAEGLVLTPDGTSVGLWIGQVVVSHVNEVQTAVNGRSELATPTADAASLRILLHVDASGHVRMLKDVVAMKTRPLGNEDPQLVLVTDPALIPNFDGVAERGGTLVGLRYGTVAYEFAGHDLPMAGGVGSSLACTGTIDLGAAMATNPFRHKFHPQHQNGYNIRRQFTIEFDDSNDTEAVTGTYRETVTGLHKIPINAEGTIVLSRISEVANLNGAE